MIKPANYKRIFDVPKTSFFLFGPRGTGKTTLIRSLGLVQKEITLLDETKYQSFLAEPRLFYEELAVLKPGSWIFIDEIQRLPQLLNEVHRLIEDRRLHFAMTGSSARKLRKAGVNLLAGRAVSRMMYPLTPMEMGADYRLEKVLQFGSLPLVVSSPTPQETLNAYSQIYLKEEIQAEALVRNLSGFSRFLPVAALFHGQAIHLSNIARDCEVQRPTVVGFFEVLEDTLLTRRLEAFESKLRVREKKKAKFYFMDPGLVRALKKQKGPVAVEEKGALLEGLIFTLLSFQKDSFGDIDSLNYWAPAEAKMTEVDFLVTKGRERIAIEVKSSNKVRREDLLGLRAISELKGLKRRILIYLGSEDRITEDGIEILSFDSFVQLLLKKEI